MVRAGLDRRKSSASILAAIKAVHTIVWGFFVACIVVIWTFALNGKLFYAVVPIGFVLIEVIVLVVNRFHCPLTSVAARYTDSRRANFDIYLPEWLARQTKVIFGGLYVGGIILTLTRWALAAL